MRTDHRRMMCLGDADNSTFLRVKAKIEKREGLKATDARIMRLAVLSLAKQEGVKVIAPKAAGERG